MSSVSVTDLNFKPRKNNNIRLNDAKLTLDGIRNVTLSLPFFSSTTESSLSSIFFVWVYIVFILKT